MLARVANNLFWMGRYIERCEHVARYLSVNYFSSLDAPNEFSQSRQFVLRSLLFMVGDVPEDSDAILDEHEVLYDIGLNPKKEYAIINCVKIARENANSARDLISSSVYESLNTFYHFIINYSVEDYKKKALYDFTTNCIEHAVILKAKIKTTLLHDEIFSIIRLGINIERSMQVIRIINAKYNDILLINNHQNNNYDSKLEWSTLLKCVESYDMMRRFYKKVPKSKNTLDFLILNQICPRSIVNSLGEVSHHIKALSTEKKFFKNSSIFLVNKIYTEYKYKYIEEIEVDFQTFIEDILEKLVAISKQVEEEYFNY